MKSVFFWFCVMMLSVLSCQKVGDQIITRKVREDWYAEGKIKSRVWYKDGKEDSLGLWFYENGQIKVVAQFSNGKQIGSTTYFYPNGNLKGYYFYNQEGDGSAMYGRDYNEKGELTEEKGTPIGVVPETKSQITLGESFNFSVISATPPHSVMTIYTATKGKDSLFYIRNIYHIKNKMPFFKHYFEREGEHPLMVISELNDTMRQEIRKDTTIVKVAVKKREDNGDGQPW